MQAYCCMLCKENDREFINICYKNGRNSAKDDILELCGNSVAQYLENDDLVCSRCMSVLDNAAKLKRQVFEILLDYGAKRQLSDKSYTRALDYAEFSHDSYYEEANEDSTGNEPSTPPMETISPPTYLGTSPNNLLMIKSSIPFDQRSDTDMEEANSKYRYYERDTPLLDREVQRANFRRRRRRNKGHNWTRRKGSQRSRSNSYARSHSHYSKDGRHTSYSRSSRGTTTSKRKEILQKSQSQQKKRIFSDFLCQNDSLAHFTRQYLNKHGIFVDDDDDLSSDYEWQSDAEKPTIRTRYASELREKVLDDYGKTIFECPNKSCEEILSNLELYTEHMVKEHNVMALFWCEQCKFSYLSQDHLDKHKEQHFEKFVSYCIYCSEEFRNKRLYEDHLNEHLIHSFPCIYCDKFFLRKQICDNHIRLEHPGRKKKIKRIKPQSILDRIDKYPDQNDELTNRTAQDSQPKFEVKILWQHGRADTVTSLANCEETNTVNFIDICTDIDTLSPSD